VAIVAAHFEQLREHGGRRSIRDPDGLEAALARPQHRHAYDANADAADLAAAYAYGIVRGHYFADGNKRTGLATALMFLELNGFQLSPAVTDDELSDVILGLAGGATMEEALARWLRARLIPLPPPSEAG